MTPAAAKRLRLLASAVSVLVVVAGIATGWFYFRLRASLPQLDGRVVIAGLGAPVTLARDALGVPTIQAASRADVARGLGWLHAQDRFFQMDLLRRNSAGELAELFGSRALNHDKAVRIHGFRTLAKQVLPTLPPEQLAVVRAYVEGVNAGLAALPAAPFEYTVLRTAPTPWTAEDTLLVGYTMALDLQDETGAYEKTLMTLRDELGPEGVAFFAPWVGPDDAALDGSTAPLPAIPGPKTLDLRTNRTVRQNAPASGALVRADKSPRAIRAAADAFPFAASDPDIAHGSNAFALSGAHTANGAGLLANDMHLSLRVPNIWYRASFEFGDRRITGATLPGTPMMVVGSNGRVAWGFTVAYADTSDLVAVDHAPGLISWYVTPEQPDGVKIERREETIRVKGGDDVKMEYPWTIWGPIVGRDHREHPLVLRWTVHSPTALSTNLLAMEDATDVASAVAVAKRAGITTVNTVIADASGKIAWTIAGVLPQRKGFDGRLPVSWVYGDRKWEGLLPPEQNPSVIDPAGGRLWSANQRMLGGDALATIGDGGFARPARAAQVRDGLATLERATPKDLLAVQLDDRALFLAPWHQLLLATLTPAVTGEKKDRATLRTLAEKWEGHASTDAVSYPIVRAFRAAVRERVFAPIFASCIESSAEFDWHRLPSEPALWALLREKPPHLLDPQFGTWDALLTAAVDDAIAALDESGGLSPRNTWGAQNTARINHPFGQLLPAWLTGWLNLPADPLAGDNDMPRVARPNDGASQRMVVAPGHEAEGIFHMPGGQSGHPLSPFYRAGHEAWVRGEATPFLPGPTLHTLELVPR